VSLKSVLINIGIAAIVSLELAFYGLEWAVAFYVLSRFGWSGPSRLGMLLCLSQIVFVTALVLLVQILGRSCLHLPRVKKRFLIVLGLGLLVAMSYMTILAIPPIKYPPPADEVLDQLGIDKENFATLASCDQVKLFTYVAPSFLTTHGLPAALPWMNNILLENGKVVAPCVIIEANDHLSQSTADTPEGATERGKILALNILLRDLQRSFLTSNGTRGADLKFPEAQRYLHNIVCRSSSPDPDATEAYFMSRFARLPSDAFNSFEESFGSEGTSKMQAMLCK
jgi:hypothetical protein